MYNNLFDSHTHYDDEQFDKDRDELILSMLSNNVNGIVHAATDIKSSLFGLEYSKKYEKFYTSIGVHPQNIDGLENDYIDKLEEMIRKKKVVAVGEIGLDYYWTKDNKQEQIIIFKEQIKMANKYDLPVIVHLRDAINDGLEILKELKPKGVIHCFSGSAQTAMELLKLSMYIGFTGVLTFNNAKKAKEACSAIPLEKLLIETDCPYMAPIPYRGKRCDSTMIENTAVAMAQIKGVSVQEILDITCNNAKTLFNI